MPSPCSPPLRFLVTGGAGFIGSHLSDRLLAAGHRVRIVDDLSAPQAPDNVAWLTERHRSRFELVKADVRSRHVLSAVLDAVDVVHHLAAPDPLAHAADPFTLFEVNLEATVRLLETLRARMRRPAFVYASSLDCGDRHDGMACSQAGAERYVGLYAWRFGLRAASLRLSPVYGPRQSDAAPAALPVAALCRGGLDGRAVEVFGTGREVVDPLFIEDAVDAFMLASVRIDSLSGRALDVGGGPAQAVSAREVADTIEELCGIRPRLIPRPGAWPEGRRRVADPRPFCAATGWRATTSLRQGLEHMLGWLVDQTPRVSLRDSGFFARARA